MLGIGAPKPNTSLLLSDPKSRRGYNFTLADDRLSPKITMFLNGVYYPNWHIYKQLPPSSLNFDVISHVFYSFAHVKPDGTVYLSDEWADDQIDVDGTKGCLRSFAALKQKYSILRLVLSVGGGGAGSEPFAAAASTDETRERFASTAKALVNKYNLDGIDSASPFSCCHTFQVPSPRGFLFSAFWNVSQIFGPSKLAS